MDVTSDAVLSVFAVILGQQPGDRKLAEQRLKALEALDSFPLTLMNLLADERAVINLRQLAAITLEHYIGAHWNDQSDSTDTPKLQPSDETKTAIRSRITHLLRTTEKRIRTVVAHLISVIAQFDWPEAWPTLMAELADLLNLAFTQGDVKPGQQKAVIHGVLTVLANISSDVSDLDIPLLAPLLMPPLIRILGEKLSFSYTLRKNVVSVIANLMNVVMEDAFYEHIGRYMELRINQLLTELSLTNPPLEASAFESEVIQLLTLLCSTAPKFLDTHLEGGVSRLLTLSLNMLIRITDTYVRLNILSGSGVDGEKADEPLDSDGDSIEYEFLVYAFLEYLSTLLNTKRYRVRLEKHLPEICYQLACLLQIPDTTLQKSGEIAEILEEREGALSCTVRQTALEVIQVCSRVVSPWSSVFTDTTCRLFVAAENQHSLSNPNWWKLLEVGLFLCSNFPTSFNPTASSFSFETLKTRYLEPSWQQTDLPFLQVTALQCLTQLSIHNCAGGPSLDSLPVLLVDALDRNKHALVRVSAVNAVSDASSRLRQVCADPTTDSHVKSVITAQISSLVAGVVDCLAVFGEPVLDNGLCALQGLLRIDTHVFVASAQSQLTTIILDLFKHCISVASTLSIYLDVLRALQLAGNVSAIEQAFMPILLTCLEQQQPVDSVAVEASLQVLGVLIRGSVPPLSPALIQRAFPAVVHLAIIGEDGMLLSACCEVLRCYLAVDVESVIDWHDDEGNNGIGYILHVASRLLDPSAPVEWATVAGRLVCAILLRLQGEQLGENTDLLLRGTLARLSSLPADATGSSQGAQQSLMFVFVVLCRMRPEAAIHFLSNVPDLSGKPVLERIMRLWCDCQPLYISQHEVRISIQALSNLLVHTITTKDSRLMQITTEEQIQHDGTWSSIAARTRQKQEETSSPRLQIPLMVKLYKLLIRELANILEEEVGYDESSGEEESGSAANDAGRINHQVSTDLTDSPIIPEIDNLGGLEDTSDDVMSEMDDPIYSNDPVLKIDIKEYLCNLFRELVRQPFYNEFSRYHTENELTILQQVGILQLT